MSEFNKVNESMNQSMNEAGIELLGQLNMIHISCQRNPTVIFS